MKLSKLSLVSASILAYTLMAAVWICDLQVGWATRIGAWF